MSSKQNWKYPDWIYSAEHKIKNLDTSKFLFPVYITHTVMRPEDNKYIPRWAIVVTITIEARDRLNGRKTKIISSNSGVYVYRSSDVEDVIFEELSYLISHELQECFQIMEYEGAFARAKIPFDPHLPNRHTSLYSFRKVRGFPHYPSYTAMLWVSAKRLVKSLAKSIVAWYKTPKALSIKNNTAGADPTIKVTQK